MTNMPPAAKKTLHPNSSRHSKAISVADAKAHLSSVLSGVEKKKKTVTILRRGVPIAQIIPFPATPRKLLGGSMAGTGRELGDIVSPLDIVWSVDEE